MDGGNADEGIEVSVEGRKHKIKDLHAEEQQATKEGGRVVVVAHHGWTRMHVVT